MSILENLFLLFLYLLYICIVVFQINIFHSFIHSFIHSFNVCNCLTDCIVSAPSFDIVSLATCKINSSQFYCVNTSTISVTVTGIINWNHSDLHK